MEASLLTMRSSSFSFSSPASGFLHHRRELSTSRPFKKLHSSLFAALFLPRSCEPPLFTPAKYCYNADTYDPTAFDMEGFNGSLVEYMLKGTEKLHAKLCSHSRYKSPDEHPFFPDDLPEPMLPPLQYPKVLLHFAADSININNKIWNMYFRDLVLRLVKKGDDGNYGSTAVCDDICLQSLSKRINYGKFVAEAKFQASPKAYESAIKAQVFSLLGSLVEYMLNRIGFTKLMDGKIES
ncbi:hypothetical protein Bca52824_023189 [Brassica carinata]|uniref:chorismate mutase n=1 Tax=Brassica carinata TaxID=52824 RepID=A0A8X8AU32_BRACI|nr:hypothetical protein Bca52824_023189 [Brassica carinata]